MRPGRSIVALMLTDDERVRPDSLAPPRYRQNH
jgi:hypothetical protein